MLSSFVGWIVFSSSSSSSSSNSSYSSSTSSRYHYEDNDQEIISAETKDNDEKNDVVLVDFAANGDHTIPLGIAVTDASAAVTVAVPATEAPIHDDTRPPITTTIITSRKRRRIDYDEDDDDILMAAQEEKKNLDDSRRSSHRLWTNEDEIQLLEGYLEHTTRRGNVIHHNDTSLFYEQIGSKLQVGFNKNQLLDKLRRMKKKYRNVLEKKNFHREFSFKSAHDQAAFEISRKIWGDTRRMGKFEETTLDDGHDQPSPTTHNHLNLVDVKVENEEVLSDLRLRKRTKSGHASKNRSILNRRNNDNNNDDVEDNINIDKGNATSLIEDTEKSCMSPWLKELLSTAFCPMPAPLSGTLQGASTLSLQGEEQVDEKGREQRILELERYSKQLELLQDQIKVALRELKSNCRE